MTTESDLLLSLQASSFKLKKRNKKSFNLSLLSPSEGILFGDRPARNARTVSIDSIAKNWKQAFRDDPPNAVLSSTEGEEPISGVFEIKKFKLKNEKINLKITFSEDQKVASKQLLSSDIITGENIPRGASLFIDSIWNWTAYDSSILINNNAGDGSEAGMGSMTVNWSNAGTMAGFAGAKQQQVVANGQATSTDDCTPIISGSTTDDFDVAAQVFFGRQEIDLWWASNPDFGHPWISGNQGGSKYYSNDDMPITGSTTQGNYKYPWTIDYTSEACDEYDQWKITYGSPTNINA